MLRKIISRSFASTAVHNTARMPNMIHRVTMFKLPGAENQAKLLAAYDKLAKEQKKDGKPYIAYVCAGQALDDARSNGYTVVSKTEFRSLEDMRYYDEECEAHKALKVTASGLGCLEKPLAVYFEGSPIVAGGVLSTKEQGNY